MAKLHGESSMLINASAKDIYAVLVDYQNSHPQILPKQYFKSLKVLKGGQGAGTEFEADLKVNGLKMTFRMLVSEPEPGRVIMESDTLSSTVTTFTVMPTDTTNQALVKIASEWDMKPGLAGLIDRLFTPGVMRGIYKKELKQLNEYMASRNLKVVA